MSREKLCEHFFEEEHAECIAFKIIEVRLLSFSCKKSSEKRKKEEKEEMNGNVAKDPISKSSSPDREEKEKLLTSLTQPAPVIVKLQKSTNSSFRSR